MRTRQRLILDILIACGLIAAYRPSWTGITLHEWVSAAIAVPLIVHLVVNWEWCLRIARTFFDRLFHASRANFVVDVGLLVSSVAVMMSGVMVSPVPGWFGIQPAQVMLWARLHALSANAIIALFVVHAVLHRKWIVSASKRVFAGEGGAAGARAAVPARAATRLEPTPAQSRRAARLAAEKAAARRRASVAGVLGAGVAIASLIFASVALAGPTLARSGAPSAPTVTATSTTALAKASAAATATTTKASFTTTAPTSAAITTKMAATTTVKKTATTTTKKTTTSATSAPAVKQTCPRTGCSAYTCHGASGANPTTWYQTHS